MKPRTLVLLVAVVVAVAAAIAGSLVAIGLGGEESGRPTGAETVLRIEPADQEVSCGPGPATILRFLDDLEARPCPRQPDVSSGVVAFQVVLRYDPAIVRIANPIDVQLNPRLSEEDADGDGVARSFFPVSSIDDFAGWALLGAASFVPSSRGPEDNGEEGLDPVARGAPLLLLTVRFQPVGHGTTALTLHGPEAAVPAVEEPAVIDSSLEGYEPVVFKGASLTVAGGDCPEPPPATPRPTPKPTSTPFVPPTIAIPTPVPVTPTPAAEGGRPDCPHDWNVYGDPDGHFSVCYPPEWSAITAAPGAYFGTTLSLEAGTAGPVAESKYVQLTMYWSERNSYEEGIRSERCSPVSHWQDVREVSLSLAGQNVVACVGYETMHPPEAPPLRGTFAEIAIGPGRGYVVLFLIEPEGLGTSTAEELSSVLASLRLGE